MFKNLLTQRKKINWRDAIKAIGVLVRSRFPNLQIHLLALLLTAIALFLYTTTWHKFLEGYEKETATAALKLLRGEYDVRRTGISAVILYLPIILFLKIFGAANLSLLSITPVVYSALTGGLLFYLGWYLTQKKSTSIILALLIIIGSVMWPYANIGMEYQAMFYLSLLLVSLLRWKNGESSLIWPAIIFALLSTAKSYGPMFGLPLLLFVALSSSKTARIKNIALAITPAIIAVALSALGQWFAYGSLTGVYSIRHEFQIWNWWEGFYGVFFAAGKGIFFFNPLLILALLKWREFTKGHRETAIFILTSFILLLLITAPFSYWTDETLTVRKLVPIIGLLHLPLLYFFQEKISWRKIQTWIVIALIVISGYAQILGASYYYGKQLTILRAGNLDSLHHMRFTPELATIPLYHALFSGYVRNINQKLIYNESTWFRWTEHQPDIMLDKTQINLTPYQTPDIIWLKNPSLTPRIFIFWGLVIADILLLLLTMKQYFKNQRRENIK